MGLEQFAVVKLETDNSASGELSILMWKKKGLSEDQLPTSVSKGA